MTDNMYSKYLTLGWSCFPIQYRGKRPLFAWGQYQEEHATDAEVERWLADHPAANVAVATGAVSGIVVVDIDSDEGKANLERHGFLPKTPYQRTGKGEHHFFAYPGFHVNNKAAFVPGVDLRADGGYVVVAPSVHPSGAKYEWVVKPNECEPASLPEWLVHLVRPKQPERVNTTTGEIVGDAGVWLDKALARAVPGNRDETGFWLACQLRDNGISYSEAENTLKDYAARVPTGDDAYTEKEALRKVRSAWSKPARSPATSQQAPAIDTSLYAEEAWRKLDAQQAEQGQGEEEQPPTRPDKPKSFVTIEDVYYQMVSELLGEPDSIPDEVPYDFPCNALHPLGGFARYAWPAKMVYILGGAGFFKTSYAEFLHDNLLKAGFDWAHYGPEWTPDEMGIRSVQRFGGVTLDEMAAARVRASDKKRQYEPERGMPLTPKQITDTLGIIDERMRWPGNGYYIPSASLSFEHLLLSVKDAINDSRNRGRQFVAVFFDYLELMRRFSVGKDDAFWGERILEVIKNMSIDYQFTAYMLLQAKKGDADRVRNAAKNGRDMEEVLLGAASAQGISDQKCNLMLTLNPEYDHEGKLTNNIYVNAVKNSGGDLDYVEMKINPRLLQFLDAQ